MKKTCVAVILAVVFLGCAEDDDGRRSNTATPTVTSTVTRTSTATPTPTVAGTILPGPQITFFGLTRADDTLLMAHDVADDGTPIYDRLRGAGGRASGFVLVIEGKPGSSGAGVGESSYDMTGAGFPDLSVQVTQALGNGSTAVCDDPQVAPGGVPATFPVSFEATPENVAAVNDFGCRFQNGRGEYLARTAASDSCVNFEGTFHFVSTDARTQFCGFINVPLGFPPGETTVTARLRDEDGNWGDPAQLIIRVAP